MPTEECRIGQVLSSCRRNLINWKGRILDVSKLREQTKINIAKNYKNDRASELASFWGISEEQVLHLYNELNIEKNKRPPNDIFSKHDHASVVSSYLNDIFLKQSLTRLMLHYDRLEFSASCLDFMKTRFPKGFSDVNFLDYGAGAADYALTFAIHGAKPIVLDLSGGPVEFAAHRFELRDIPVSKVVVDQNTEFPALPSCEIVNACEVLEHVSDPARVIFNIWNALTPGGYFMFSDFPIRKKSVGGAHIPQAAHGRVKANELLHLLFSPVYHNENLKYVYIFQKRDR